MSDFYAAGDESEEDELDKLEVHAGIACWDLALEILLLTGVSQTAPCRHVASLLQQSQSLKDHIVFLVDASAAMHEAANIADPEVRKLAHFSGSASIGCSGCSWTERCRGAKASQDMFSS